jgi:hypothetical protein
MARVQIFQGGNVAPAQTTDARFRGADYGPSGLGEGLQKLGAGLAEAAQKSDEIADINAHVEANRLAVEHTELVKGIGRTVKETLGENADVAAHQGAADLDKGTKDILGRASPRARLLLENEFSQRNAVASDSFLDHGFQEKVTAFESSSIARIDNLLEDAADEDDEAKALTIIQPVKDIIAQRRRFFGRDAAWEMTEDHKYVSGFFKSRALKLANGQNGSANAAIEYATANRRYMSDGDYNAVVSAYSDNALDELADHLIDGAPLPSATTSETETGRKLDPVAFFQSFVVPHEGSAYVVDSNGAGVKYGFNEKSFPGVNVKGLTLQGATDLFVRSKWRESGAERLAPALAAVHMDTFFLNEKKAKQILRDSGGNVDRYIELRSQFLDGLVRSNPGKYGRYEKAWRNRTHDLQQFAARQGTDGSPLPVGPDTNLQDWKDGVMARTDIGAALKHKLIQRAEERRSDARQEQAIVEQDATGKLAMAAANLGDNFTDVKQLPQDAWLSASEQTRAQYINAAKTNKEQKPLKPELAAQIGFLRTFSPQSLADPKVLTKFSAQGVPQRVITQLAEEGGRAKGTIAGAKPDYADRGVLESLARPAFEAAGHRLWTTEAGDKRSKKKGLTAAEQRDDAQRSIQLLNYLETESVAWSLANPGKKADTKTMQQWIATSLIQTTGVPGRPFGTLTDHEVINTYGQRNYNGAVQKLRAAGLDPTPANVANYLRRFQQRSHGLR